MGIRNSEFHGKDFILMLKTFRAPLECLKQLLLVSFSEHRFSKIHRFYVCFPTKWKNLCFFVENLAFLDWQNCRKFLCAKFRIVFDFFLKVYLWEVLRNTKKLFR